MDAQRALTQAGDMPPNLSLLEWLGELHQQKLLQWTRGERDSTQREMLDYKQALADVCSQLLALRKELAAAVDASVGSRSLAAAGRDSAVSAVSSAAGVPAHLVTVATCTQQVGGHMAHGVACMACFALPQAAVTGAVKDPCLAACV
jgi:hypothetical protein